MISVIITVFEQATSLEMLLYCLQAQEIDEQFEVIICDDGSSIDSLAAIRGSTDLGLLNIRYIWQSKRGHRASSSKNNGIKCAEGDILVFIDGDILVKPSFLRDHRDAHNTSRQIVCNPRRWIFEPRRASKVHTGTAQPCHSQALVAKLSRLAKNDLEGLFKTLEDVCFDQDDYQRRLFLSNEPWMACIGFSFSIDNGPDVHFDENFVGWGPEDREFALRMVKAHGHSVSFREDIEVFHLEACSTGREPLSLPRTPTSITQFLRNMIYFRSLYPNEDLSPIMVGLMAYRFDPARGDWELTPAVNRPRKLSAETINMRVRFVTEWLRARSLFPEPNV